MEKLRQILDVFKDTDSIFGSTDFRLVIDLLIKYELLKEGISEDDQVLIALLLAKRFTDIQKATAAIKHNKQAVMAKTIRFLQDYEVRISKLNSHFEKEPIRGITIRYETKGKNRQLSKEEIELLISILDQTKDIHLARLKKKFLSDVKEEEIEEALADAFYTIFTKLDQLKEFGAFEAWSRKITVNHCLATIKKFLQKLQSMKLLNLPKALVVKIHLNSSTACSARSTKKSVSQERMR